MIALLVTYAFGCLLLAVSINTLVDGLTKLFQLSLLHLDLLLSLLSLQFTLCVFPQFRILGDLFALCLGDGLLRRDRLCLGLHWGHRLRFSLLLLFLQTFLLILGHGRLFAFHYLGFYRLFFCLNEFLNLRYFLYLFLLGSFLRRSGGYLGSLNQDIVEVLEALAYRVLVLDPVLAILGLNEQLMELVLTLELRFHG